MERLGERNVTSISEWGDDQSWGVTQILIRISELGIANVDVAMIISISPSSAKLSLPDESLGIFNLNY